MIDLIVTGHAEPEQSREEIARLLNEYGVGAVCLLRNGAIMDVKRRAWERYDFGKVFVFEHEGNGMYWHEDESQIDIIRVFPPGTRLRVTVEVVDG